MTPLVYVLEEQVRDLLTETGDVRLIDGVAYGFDYWMVFHAYTDKPSSTPAGFTCPCVATHGDAAGFVDEEKLMAQVRRHIDPNERPIVVLVAGTSATGSPSCRALILTEKGVAGADTRFVHRSSELFTRNTGLLEVSALAEKKVVIVGLGSGGSPIALELARAGIGHFTLIYFDRLELGNISRHVCGVNDLGRYKTIAVRDQMLQKNPYADV